MRRLILTLAAMLPGFLLGAQNSTADKLVSLLDGNRVRVSYSYENASGVPLGSGSATVQGTQYHVVEGNMQFFSNGSTLWSVDAGSKEVYIENAGSESDFFGNLKKVLSNIQDLEYDGKKSVSLKFVPTENSEKISCKAFIEDIRTASDDVSQFSFDTGKLNSSWIITDLR